MTNGELEIESLNRPQLMVELETARTSLARVQRFGELLATISTQLINLKPGKATEGIHGALKELGMFLKVDRIYVFLFDEAGEKIDQTHEWCVEGVQPHPFEVLHGVPVSAFPWSMDSFRRGEAVHVLEPGDLPEEAAPEKGACEQFGIRSYVNVPLFASGLLKGWGGLDSVNTHREWEEGDVTMTRLVGEVVINSLIRLREGQLLQDVKTLSELVPICSWCRKLRDDEGYWHQVETYMLKHSEFRFSHGICPGWVTKMSEDGMDGPSGK